MYECVGVCVCFLNPSISLLQVEEMQLQGNCMQNYTVTMSGRISSVRRGITSEGAYIIVHDTGHHKTNVTRIKVIYICTKQRLISGRIFSRNACSMNEVEHTSFGCDFIRVLVPFSSSVTSYQHKKLLLHHSGIYLTKMSYIIFCTLVA